MITREVEVSAVADLALTPPRAALAAAVDDEVLVFPANVTMEEPADLQSSPRIVRLPSGVPDMADRNVVLIADDGPQWFRLRALTIRGMAKATSDCTYRVVPTRLVAWDYGSLREVSTPLSEPAPLQESSAAGDEGGDPETFDLPKLQAALNKSRVMILASLSPKGTPFAVPLWFIPHHGRIFATTSASSWTARNVAARSQVAILLGGEGQDNGNRLLVRGHGQVVNGMPPAAVLARIAWLYYLQPRFAAVELSHIRLWWRRMRYYRQSQAAYIVITPRAATEYPMP